VNVYIVIATFNGKQWISACFSSIYNSTIPLKTIVVDNGSTDGTPGIIKEQFPDVEIIQSKTNLGFGRANNIGIKKAYHAGADYIFLLNQDAWLEISTIEKLVSAQKKQSEFDIVSPMHLNSKGNALDYGFSCYISPENCKGLYSDIYIKKNTDQIYNATFVNAAGWLITRYCVSKIGGFNPSFYHYAEDINYLHRLKYFGLNLGVYPNCYIFHDREDKSPEMNYENEMEIYKRQIILNISNPSSELTFFSEGKYLFKKLFRSLITMRFSQLRRLIAKIFSIYNIDKAFIIENKKKSKCIGLTFLE
jgi:GT2 family glycosyltransferase